MIKKIDSTLETDTLVAGEETNGSHEPGLGEQFVRIYEDYMNQVKEAWETLQQLGSSNSRFQSDLIDLRAEISKKSTDVWRNYIEVARKTQTSEEEGHSALEAYFRYLHDYHAIQQEFTQKWNSLQQASNDEVRAGRKQYVDRCATAYSKYMDNTKSAWQAANVKGIDALSLAQISQLMAHTAQHAWSVTSRAS
jgi:hypothetical protein